MYQNRGMQCRVYKKIGEKKISKKNCIFHYLTKNILGFPFFLKKKNSLDPRMGNEK